MGNFCVELKKVVDDSYEIETGFELENKLIEDLQNGLVGNIKKFAVITDSIVKDLYATRILGLLNDAGFKADMFVFEAGEKSKVRKTKEEIEDAMLLKGFRRDCSRWRCCNRPGRFHCWYIWKRCTIYKLCHNTFSSGRCISWRKNCS